MNDVTVVIMSSCSFLLLFFGENLYSLVHESKIFFDLVAKVEIFLAFSHLSMLLAYVHFNLSYVHYCMFVNLSDESPAIRKDSSAKYY